MINLRYYLIVVAIIFLIGIPMRILITLHRRKKRLLKYVGHLSSPVAYPIVGSGLRFIGKNSEEIMKDSIQFMATHKTPFYAWAGPYLLIVVDKPEDAHTVLTSKSCMNKAPIYKYFNRVGLLTAPVHIWKPQRKILNSAFNLRILQSFIPLFNEKVTCLVRNLDGMVGKGSFDILHLLHSCTLDMICSTTLGANLDSQNGKNVEYLNAWRKGLALVCERMVNVFYYSDFIYKRTKHYRVQQKVSEAMDSLPRKIIKQQKIEYSKQNPTHLSDVNIDGNDEDGPSFETPQIFINKLLRLHAQGLIDDKSIHDQVNLMIFAGNDTSALTMAHAMLLLAMHPDIQKRATEEVDQVYADTSIDAPSTYHHLTKLVYIEQIIREAMRLFPIAPFIFRICKADTQISECIVPRGATVVVSVYTMHRNPDIWGPQANEFNPDHFHPDQMNKRNPNAFAAFSLGQRNCIGMQYAYISMKMMVATMLRHFKFSTHLKMSDIQPKIEITLKLACGDLVQVERRSQTPVHKEE